VSTRTRPAQILAGPRCGWPEAEPGAWGPEGPCSDAEWVAGGRQDPEAEPGAGP